MHTRSSLVSKPNVVVTDFLSMGVNNRESPPKSENRRKTLFPLISGAERSQGDWVESTLNLAAQTEELEGSLNTSTPALLTLQIKSKFVYYGPRLHRSEKRRRRRERKIKLIILLTSIYYSSSVPDCWIKRIVFFSEKSPSNPIVSLNKSKAPLPVVRLVPVVTFSPHRKPSLGFT